MSRKVAFVYTSELEKYEMGEDHPLDSLRLRLTFELLRDLEILPDEEIVVPEPAKNADLYLVHDRDYVSLVQEMSQKGVPDARSLTYGLGTEDNPIFPGMHEAGLLIVGATLQAARLVMTGEVEHAAHIGGGLHHALPGRASGFCIYNDVAVAIAYLKKEFGARVAYIDTDAHHGDGVQWIFYHDPDVLTISFHETGRYLFPGTGRVNELGSGAGYGYSVNVPLEPFTEDDSWIRALRMILPPLLRAFKPDVIISQNGCDGHRFDPLTHLLASTRLYREAPRLVHELAHELTGGRWIALGGGGYDIWRVVPRAWALLWGEMSERRLPRKLPQSWLQRWSAVSPVPLREFFCDDPYEFPPTPRRPLIYEKNILTAKNVLKTVLPILKKNTVPRRRPNLGQSPHFEF